MSKEMKDGRVPRLRFPEFRGVGGWQIEALGSKTTKIGSGITPTGGDTNYKAEGRPFVRSQNIGWGCLILENVAYIDEVTHATFLSTEIMQGDVLLNITGASIGRSAVADQSIEGGNVNQHVCIIRPMANKLNPYFLNQFLLSDGGQIQVDSFQAGGNRQGLNFAQIKSFTIPCPPILDEQQKIADCLASVDALISAQRKKVEELKTYKNGLMQQLFLREGETIPHLRFIAFRGAGSWENSTLGNIATITSGGTPSRSKQEYWDGNIPWVTTSLIDFGLIQNANEFISAVGLKESSAKIFPKNTILMAMYGQGITRGKVAVLGIDAATNQACAAILLKKGLNAGFVFQNLAGRYAEIRDLSNQGGQENLSGGLIEKISFSYPSSNVEQQKIADCLTNIDALITAQTQKLEALKTHKKGLMQALFPAPDEVEA